jgi:hypothetical protein
MTRPTDHSRTVRIADRPDDYRRLGIDPVEIRPFEDGQRIEPAPGAYEWWYFDAHLDDGAKLVVVFYTKPLMAPGVVLAPMITINLDFPDGRSIVKTLHAAPDAFSASRDGCDVRIGDNRFTGDLHRYRITASIEEVSVDVEMVGEIRPWRPKSGHIYFGAERGEHLFAWLPSVPQGRVTATYRVGAQERRTTGIGYHDHNWGDVQMPQLMHNWYWGRAKVGPYTVIASYITATEAHGFEPLTIFLLAKDGRIVVDDAAKVSFSMDGVRTDAVTGKPVADITRYEYRDGEERIVVTFRREKTVLQRRFTDLAPWWKRLAAKLAGINPAYLRFTGQVTLQRFDGAEAVETIEQEALWELMYFGRPRRSPSGTARATV